MTLHSAGADAFEAERVYSTVVELNERHDEPAVVTYKEDTDRVYVRFEDWAKCTMVERLIRDHGFLISPSTPALGGDLLLFY